MHGDVGIAKGDLWVANRNCNCQPRTNTNVA